MNQKFEHDVFSKSWLAFKYRYIMLFSYIFFGTKVLLAHFLLVLEVWYQGKEIGKVKEIISSLSFRACAKR